MQTPATRNDFKQTVQARAPSELTKVRTVHEIKIFLQCKLGLFFFFEHVLKKVGKHSKQLGIFEFQLQFIHSFVNVDICIFWISEYSAIRSPDSEFLLVRNLLRFFLSVKRILIFAHSTLSAQCLNLHQRKEMACSKYLLLSAKH